MTSQTNLIPYSIKTIFLNAYSISMFSRLTHQYENGCLSEKRFQKQKGEK